jgi:hypothetical protein
MDINVNNVKNSIIAGGNVNIGTMESSDKPKGWKYEIRVGKDVGGLQTWTTEKIKDTFSKYLAEIDIEDFETGEKIGYWRGEPEESNLMVIIRKAEDGDVYDGLRNVVKMANTVLKQDAILISKTDLSDVNFES